MKFEIKPSYKQTIQTLPSSVKDIAKKMSGYFIDIMEDPRKRYKAISQDSIQLAHLNGPYWFFMKIVNIKYIFNRCDSIDAEGYDHEMSKDFSVKITFTWDINLIEFLKGEFSPIGELVSDSLTRREVISQFHRPVRNRLKEYEENKIPKVDSKSLKQPEVEVILKPSLEPLASLGGYLGLELLIEKIKNDLLSEELKRNATQPMFGYVRISARKIRKKTRWEILKQSNMLPDYLANLSKDPNIPDIYETSTSW